MYTLQTLMTCNRLLSNLPFLNTHLLIFGGDLNCVIHQNFDRSNPRTLNQSAMSKTFSDFMGQNGLVDPWRSRNSALKKFSFFSQVLSYWNPIRGLIIFYRQHSWFLCSFFWLFGYCNFWPCDHELDIHLSIYKRSRPPWRFNSLLLADSEFCEFISTSIDDFLFFNQNDSTSYSLLWETLKSYIRGQIISYSTLCN